MIVCKFGGTSVGSAERFAAAAARVEERRGRGCVAVVSAMAQVTRELHRMGALAAAGDLAAARAQLAATLDHHRETLAALEVGDGAAAWVDAAIAHQRWRLDELLAAVAARRALAPSESDRLLASGELLSSRLLAAALRRRGVAVAWVDPRDLVVTDARFGRARPDETAIAAAVERWVRPAVDGGEVVVTGGFVGRTPAGETTILGWESSDYTATLLGAALRADLVEIWSDVDGVFTADPRLVAGAVQVPLLSYREAADLAFFGAKVLHPATMEPVARDGVPVRIRNSFAPEREGTLVTREGAGLGIRGIAAEEAMRRRRVVVAAPPLAFLRGDASM